MNPNYNKNPWSEVTRDERFFCAELYQIINNNKHPFNQLLAEKGIIDSVHTEYDIGYEVCFYRDFICKYGYEHNGKENHQIKTIKDKEENLIFPPKRTFDLCLFLKDEIIIIEAKAQQGFKTDQLDEFTEDRRHLKDLLNIEDKNIKIIGLFSSKYTPSDLTLDYFENEGVEFGYFTWKEIYEIYPTPFRILDRADKSFSKKCS